MSGLKVAVLALGGVLLVAAGATALLKGPIVLVVYFLVGGVIILAGTIFERGRYNPNPTNGSDDWEMTAERFKDAVTGTWMRVRYNRRTGERDYIEEDRIKKER